MQVFKGTDGKGTSETSEGYSGVSRVGWTDWGACRTLLKLNGFSFSSYGIIDESQIKSAYVELRDLMCQGGSGVPISCGQFNGNYWNEGYTKTWNELNASNSSLGSFVSVTYGNGNSQRKLSDKDQWYNWNVAGIVKKWINDISLKEKGLQFRTYASFFEESSVYSDYMKTFSSMQGNTSYKPYFCIKYKHKMVYNAITQLSSEDNRVATNTVSLFDKMEYPSKLYLRPTVEQIYKNANSSNVLVFHGHGSPGYINIEQNREGTTKFYSSNKTYSLDQIPASAWSHISFVYFATCQSGTMDSENGRNSMVDQAHKLGADCVIGFKNNVSGAEDFLNYMANAIYESSTPLTIDEAVSIAMSKYSKTERKEEDCPANPKNLYIVGNKSICLKK